MGTEVVTANPRMSPTSASWGVPEWATFERKSCAGSCVCDRNAEIVCYPSPISTVRSQNKRAPGKRGTHHDDARGRVLQRLFDELREDLREVRRPPAERPVVLRLGAQVRSGEDEAEHVIDLLRGEETVFLVHILERDTKLPISIAQSVPFPENAIHDAALRTM